MIIGFRVTSVPSDFGMFASFFLSFAVAVVCLVWSVSVAVWMWMDGLVADRDSTGWHSAGCRTAHITSISCRTDGPGPQTRRPKLFTVPARSCSCRKIP